MVIAFLTRISVCPTFGKIDEIYLSFAGRPYSPRGAVHPGYSNDNTGASTSGAFTMTYSVTKPGLRWCDAHQDGSYCVGNNWKTDPEVEEFRLAGEVFPVDTWTHVALVHAADGAVSIYFDGVLKGTGNVHLPRPIERSGYHIGKGWEQSVQIGEDQCNGYQDGSYCTTGWQKLPPDLPPNPYFDGEMRDFFVFNRPLAQDELARLWGTTCAAPPPPPPCTHSPAVVYEFADVQSFPGTATYSPDNGKANVDYVEATPTEAIGGKAGLTIAAWVKRPWEASRFNDRIVDLRSGTANQIYVGFSLGPDHALQDALIHYCVTPTCISMGESSSSRLDTIQANTWTHVALVHEADGMATIYVNGVFQFAKNVPLPPSVSRTMNWIGKGQDEAGWGVPNAPYFKGEMKHLHVINRPLSHDELTRLWDKSMCTPDLR